MNKMEKNIDKPKKFISLNKIKMQRGYSYISVFGIPFLVARELGEIFPQLSWLLLFVAAITGVWIVGHIDFKKGFLGYELEYTLRKNPEWTKLVERIKQLEEGQTRKK